MLTGSPLTAAPRARPRAAGAALIRVLPALLVIAGTALVLYFAYHPWYLNYDARYALLWARDILDGHKPAFGADFAPTPHPLSIAGSLIAAPFGEGGADVVTWAVLLSFGALVWLVHRLGARLFNPWVGAVAALVVATRPALDRDALLAYQDVFFETLVVGAALLEARRPRRGAAVLVVLALAGLLRPDAWALAALYAVWVWRGRSARERAGIVALVLAGPVLWGLMGWIVTGDPLHALHGTAALASEVGRRRHIWQAPRWTAEYFGYTLREPLVIGVPIGLAFAWLHRRRAAALPFACAAVMTIVFVCFPLFGLPLIGRYVRTPAILLTLFYGLAVCGWTLLPRGRARSAWMALGALAAALSLAYIPWQARMLDGLHTRVQRDGAFYEQVRDLGRAPAVRAAFARCAPLSTADHRPIPFLRWWLDGQPGSVGTIEDGKSPRGRLVVAPRRTMVSKRFYGPAFPSRRLRARPPHYVLVYRNAGFVAYARASCTSG